MTLSSSAPFTVMDASAGSGKTRNLIKSVLEKALAEPRAENALRPIMAITFTNKAANEMKERLLKYLDDFQSENPGLDGLFPEVCDTLQLEPNEVQKRAKLLLKHLLHQYNDLSFSTIDSFTSRLVRTFAKDLALSENFEVVLDANQLLQESVDLVISEAGKNQQLTTVLMSFVESNLADERSWNIQFALQKMAQKLLAENHRQALEEVREISPDQMLSAHKELQKSIVQKEAFIIAQGKKGLDLIAENGLSIASFYQGNKGFANFFNHLSKMNIESCIHFNKYAQKTIEEGSYYAGKATAEQRAAIDSIIGELIDIAETGRAFAEENAPFILLAKNVVKNIFAMATLGALENALRQIEETQNVLPLSMFNHIVNAQIKNQPAPFLFERLGERYQHFFIDEFQDTSKLQWENLRPLIENGLAAAGSSLIVGDAKQSIYRWRNGEAEQFIELSDAAKSGKFTPAILANLLKLEDNWRSRKTVVEFNNVLFGHAATHLENDTYKDLYNKAAQIPQKGEGGFVQIKQFAKDDFNSMALESTLQEIESLKNEGFAFRDIALLVRNKKIGAELVKMLTTRGIPVISQDSLLLGNAYESRLLAGAVAQRTAPKNKIFRWMLAEALHQLDCLNTDLFSFAFPLIRAKNANDAWQIIEAEFPGFLAIKNAPTDLYTFAAQLARLFNLEGKGNAFTQAFLRELHHFVDVENGGSHEFARWWEEAGQGKAIAAPDELDAVQVLTIHKSKGLQYPVVLVPFVNWRFTENSREAWIDLSPEKFAGLPKSLMSISKTNAAIIGGQYEQVYHELTAQEKFDSLNMLYVACTRAQERLYLFGSEKPSASDIFSVFLPFLEENKTAETEPSIFEWGKKETPESTSKPTVASNLQKVNTTSWQHRLKIARTAPPHWETEEKDARQWGNKVHYILAKISDETDVLPVLFDLQNAGEMPPHEFDKLKNLIEKVVQHPQLIHAYSASAKALNERDILLPNLQRKRPDRVAILPEGDFFLIDYKTGEPANAHANQLNEYAALLAESGFAVSQKALVYLGEEVVVNFVA